MQLVGDKGVAFNLKFKCENDFEKINEIYIDKCREIL